MTSVELNAGLEIMTLRLRPEFNWLSHQGIPSDSLLDRKQHKWWLENVAFIYGHMSLQIIYP